MNDNKITLDQIPDNPLGMPPPFWRSSGAIFHVIEALEELPSLLSKLIPVLESTELRLEKYFEQHPNESEHDEGDEENDEFSEICNDLWELEHKIKLKCEIIIFMCAIQAEDKINRFCVFNLHKDIAESIESLSPSEKILIASASVGKANTKGTNIYEAIKRLSSWRNAFAHGHCVDRPTKSLRHNHLITPSQYPGVPDSLARMQELTLCFLKIDDYLSSISLNEYTMGTSADNDEVLEYLNEITAYKFVVSPDSNDIYEIKYQKR